MIQPLDQEAHEKLHTPSVHGVVFERFLGLQFFQWMADAIGRPLTNDERRLFVDFEWELENQPKMHICSLCNGTFPGVWWKLPTKEFLRNLRKTKDLKESLRWYLLPDFGSHFMNKKDPLAKPISLCGHAFPGRDYVKGGFEESCLRLHCTMDEKLHGEEIVWGRRFASIFAEQSVIREMQEAKRREQEENLALMQAYEEEKRRKVEAKQARREARLKQEHLDWLAEEEAKKRRKEAEKQKLSDSQALQQKEHEARSKKSEQLHALTA